MTIHIDTPENPAGFDPSISRRTFLKRAGMAAAAGAALAGSGAAARRAFAATTTVSGSASYTDHTIAAGDVLRFDPNATTTVTVSGSTGLVVLGTLEMRPANSSVVHTLRLTGGGEIMVNAGGKLDIHGTPKTAWKRSGTDGTWTSGDELRVTPTAPGQYSSSSFTLGGTPSSISSPQGTFTAEVFNLTRNVVIEGTSGTYMKRIMFMGLTGPQTIKYARIRYIGDSNELGFYPLHFHKNGDATRGSLIEGVVVHDSDHHAFVPHGSHGMTFRNCVAYNIKGDAFWWDPFANDYDPGVTNDSEDTLYENCLATDMTSGVVSPQGETSGFYMSGGAGNKAIGCVAACTPPYNTHSGFHWGSKNNGTDNTWVFEDCVSHNHGDWGVFVWQNTGTQNHNMTRYVAYSNGRGAVKHGAYNNWGYHYIDNVYWGNGGPVALHAQVAPPQVPATFISWQNTYFDGDPCIHIADHVLQATAPAVFLENTFGGEILVDESKTGNPQRGYIDFVRNLRSGRDLEPSDFDVVWMQADSRIRVQRTDGSAFQIDGPNGSVSTISAFYNEGSIKPLPPAPGTTGWEASCGNT